jgi:hypothetical protein
MNSDVLITVLSWEDRYFLGLERDLAEYKPTKVILFKYNNLLTAEWKEDNFRRTKELLGNKLEVIEVNGEFPNKTWDIFKETFLKFCTKKSVVIDITTMPREAIWLSLYNCKLNDCETHYVYYRPENYSEEWISRDPAKPRLLYKMSGIAQLGVPSLLLVTGGYDIQRLDSLIYNFEPQQTMLFFQDGIEKRNKDNFKKCQDLFRAKYNLDLLYEYDAYNVEASYDLILEKLSMKENGSSKSYLDNYNVILNSLGAKTSAITLFNIWLKYPKVALSYIPSREYNKEYSMGIGQSFFGKISF